jgi:hypothetical protein
MLRFIFVFIVVVHGLIHVLGFVKAYEFADVAQLTQSISKPFGLLWLLATVLFIGAAIGFLLDKEWWWMIAACAIVLSQVLIVMSWQDAKFGTIANVIVLIVAVASFGSTHFENSFRADVDEHLKTIRFQSEEVFTEEDLRLLPKTVQCYLRYAGVVNKPKVRNVRIVFEGEMRSKGKDFFPFTSIQYNFFDEPTRLFFMKGRMFGVTVPGYHKYTRGAATMDIRLFGLYSIVKQSGEILDKTETVTLFNDMCLMAPATLIDKRIQWEEIDGTRTKATYTNRGISITAILFFNEQGQLIDFVSEDRTEINDMKRYPFSTPVSSYKNIQGVNVMTHGETIYEYPDGKFTYGRFELKSIEYNCK